jgi:enoyl-CoA hydratase/carnithine racemase
VDRETARKLYDAFVSFDADQEVHPLNYNICWWLLFVAILTGAGGNFCAGAGVHPFVTRLTSDLKAMLGADGKVSGATGNHFDFDDMTGQGPMGYFSLDYANK